MTVHYIAEANKSRKRFRIFVHRKSPDNSSKCFDKKIQLILCLLGLIYSYRRDDPMFTYISVSLLQVVEDSARYRENRSPNLQMHFPVL